MKSWSAEEWVRAAELLIIFLIDAFSVMSIYQNMRHIALRIVDLDLIKFAIGRIFRHFGIICWSLGIIQSTIINFGDALTIRSVTWMAGAWFFFVAWSVLDRNRWTPGKPIAGRN